MKLKLKNIFWLVGLLLFSCQNNTESPAEGLPSAMAETRELDLQNFSYDDVQALLKGEAEIRNLRLTDGEIVKTVPILRKMDGVEIAGTDENDAFFYTGAKEDSVCIIVEKSYASIKFNHQGEELGYVAATDQNELDRSIERYNEAFPQTRANQNLFTRSSNNRSLKIDVSALSRTLLSEETKSTCTPLEAEKTEEMENLENPVQTRSAYYTQWPRYNRLTMHVVRDAGNWPLEWELTWQINDMITSLRNIRSDLDIRVWRSSTNYASITRHDSGASLYSFANYCRSSLFPWKESAGHDIIVLVRWGAYSDGTAGRGYLDAYKLSRYDNPSAYGVSATSPLYAKVLAHEVGHILGAEHVPATPWWQFWRSDDVMAPTAGKLAPYHWNIRNRNIVWDNLH